MKTYEFDVVLKDLSEITDEQTDLLFEAGCDDGTPTSRDSQAWVHFYREASSLEQAIRSAVAQVQSAGFDRCQKSNWTWIPQCPWGRKRSARSCLEQPQLVPSKCGITSCRLWRRSTMPSPDCLVGPSGSASAAGARPGLQNR